MDTGRQQRPRLRIASRGNKTVKRKKKEEKRINDQYSDIEIDLIWTR